MGFKKIGTISGTKTGPQNQFLPNKEGVEGRIAGREDLLSKFVGDSREEAERVSEASLGERILHGINPVNTVKSAAGALDFIGGVGQRAEASVANALLDLQDDTPGNTGTLQEMIGESVKGLTGERLGQIGDLTRNTGFGGPANEALSSILGLGASVVGSNYASGKVIANGFSKMSKAIGKDIGVSKLRKARKAGKFIKNQADVYSEGIDDAFTGMHHEYKNVYSKIGNNEIAGDDLAKVNEIADRLPRTIVNKIKKEFKTTGNTFDSNINSVKSVQKKIGRDVPRKIWNGLDQATPEQAQLIDDYFELGDIIAKNAGDESSELLRLNAKMSELFKLNQRIRPILKKSSGTTRTTIRNIRSESMAGELDDIQRFNKRFFKNGNEVLKAIDNYNMKKNITNNAKKVAGIGGGIGVGSAIIGKIIKSSSKASGVDDFIDPSN